MNFLNGKSTPRQNTDQRLHTIGVLTTSCRMWQKINTSMTRSGLW